MTIRRSDDSPQFAKPCPNRRLVLASGLAAAAFPAFPALAATAERRLGMIFPTSGAGEPSDARQMYPEGVRYLRKGVGLPAMTVAGYSSVIDRVAPTAKALADEGAEAVILMGTSLSFYNGAAFNRDLAKRMADATGLPTTTMSTAVAEGLRSVGGKRLAVATAYVDEVNQRLVTFLREEGFEVLTIRGLGISDVGPQGGLTKVTQDGLLGFCSQVYEAAPKADAMLVSCGGLRTLELLSPLEKRHGIPVVSSMPHAIRAGVRLLGHDGRYPGHGVLLEKT